MYLEKIKELRLPSSSFELIARLSEIKGMFETEKTVKLSKNDLSKVMIETITATIGIENYTVGTNKRAKELMDGRDPESEDEVAFNANKELLEFIINDHKNIRISYSDILNLHKLLQKDLDPTYAGKVIGGKVVKSFDGKSPEGRVVLTGSSPFTVEKDLRDLIDTYNHFKDDPEVNNLILCIVFICEFLAIHPFNDGNGRLGRALFTLLLLKNGYNIPLYQSIDKLINEDRDIYYDSLGIRSKDWDAKTFNIDSLSEFVMYMISKVASAYISQLEDYSRYIDSKKIKDKKIFIKNIMENIDNYSRDDVYQEAKGLVSKDYISKILDEEVKTGNIKKEGTGRGTKYFK